MCDFTLVSSDYLSLIRSCGVKNPLMVTLQLRDQAVAIEKQDKLLDEASLVFANDFYLSLLRGSTVGDAVGDVEEGRPEVRVWDILTLVNLDEFSSEFHQLVKSHRFRPNSVHVFHLNSAKCYCTRLWLH